MLYFCLLRGRENFEKAPITVEAGPVFLLDGLASTFGNIRLIQRSYPKCTELAVEFEFTIINGLIYYDGIYYSDFEVISAPEENPHLLNDTIDPNKFRPLVG